jgi:hypothetical protein
MDHDAGWWSLLVAIVALLLTIPASVGANLLTPVLKNWWAARSIVSLRKRIKSLESELGYREMFYGNISEAEHYILLGIEVIGRCLSFILEAAATAFIAAFLGFHRSHPAPVKLLLCALFLGAMGGGGGFAMSWQITKIASFRRNASPVNRAKYKRTIAKLKAELERKENLKGAT